MTVTLLFTTDENKECCAQNFSSREAWEKSGYLEAFRKADQSKAGWSIFIIPVRVDSGKNFAKDFFLPLTVNLATKANGIALKIITGIICFILDVATFPLRIISAIPWIFLAPKKENNEFYIFLKSKQVPESVLAGTYVKVTMTVQDAELKRELFDEFPRGKFKAALNFTPFFVLV